MGVLRRISRVEGRNAVRELYVLDGDAEELGWQERALCAQTDPEAFFPRRRLDEGGGRAGCADLDVRSECLEYALEHDYVSASGGSPNGNAASESERSERDATGIGRQPHCPSRSGR